MRVLTTSYPSREPRRCAGVPALAGQTVRGLLLAVACVLLVSPKSLAATPTPAPHDKPAPTPGYLGIDVHDVARDQVATLRLKNTHGAEIVRVDHDGPAGKMGLHVHDVVLEMNGVRVDGEARLRKMLKSTQPGTSVRLSISREGQPLTLSGVMADHAQVARDAWQQHLAIPGTFNAGSGSAGQSGLEEGGGAPPEPAATAPAPASPASKSFLSSLLTSPTYTGALLEVMSPQLMQYFGATGRGGGLLVRSVERNSPAEMAGLRAGDVVTRADLKPMGSVSAWTKVIKDAKGRPVTLSVTHERTDRLITLIPDVKHK